MMDISNEQAYLRAYRLKKHQRRLCEIRDKPGMIDNHLSESLAKLPKKKLACGSWWSDKITHENKILLGKLIDIKLKKTEVAKSMTDFKITKPKEPKIDNTIILARIENVSSSLSTKNLIKDYQKYKNHLELRSKIFNKKLAYLKKIAKEYNEEHEDDTL